MHSKYSVLEIFKKFDFSSFNGFCSIKLFDPYLWNFVSAKLNQNQNWKSLFSTELTIAGLESSLQNLSLFEAEQYYIVHEAEKLSKDLQKWIIEHEDLFSQKSFLFVFRENCPWRKKWFDLGTHVTIEPPKFWEEGQTLQLLSELLNIQMSKEAQSLFIDRVPFSWGEYTRILQELVHDFQGKIEASDLTLYLKKLKLDKFKLASLLATKQKALFWNTLFDLEISQDELREVFLFMQSHLFKMINVEEILSKPKPNKYERDILQTAKSWSKKDLFEELQKFSDWELRIKMKDAFLIPELRAHTFS
jgi:hypothetical protein